MLSYSFVLIRNGNFSVKRSPGKFNKVPTDQAIEQSINREQKCSGGIKGYSTSPGTIQRWVLTSHIASKCMTQMQEEFGNRSDSVPKDLRKTRMEFHITNVETALEVLTS